MVATGNSILPALPNLIRCGIVLKVESGKTKRVEKGIEMVRVFIVTVLMLTAVSATIRVGDVQAGFPGPPGLPAPPGLPGPPGVDVRINGFLPAPPGVHIFYEAERPYYVERGRHVYLERDRRHYRKKYRHERENRGHEDNGRGHGHR
jgi:hypothetical protein